MGAYSKHCGAFPICNNDKLTKKSFWGSKFPMQTPIRPKSNHISFAVSISEGCFSALEMFPTFHKDLDN